MAVSAAVDLVDLDSAASPALLNGGAMGVGSNHVSVEAVPSKEAGPADAGIVKKLASEGAWSRRAVGPTLVSVPVHVCAWCARGVRLCV